MNISCFDDLLQMAREQDQPQRLLMVFVVATLPDNPTDEQRASFEAGAGGELAPAMCVDKDALTLLGFDELAREAAGLAQPWVLAFAAALSGSGGQPPSQEQVSAALNEMVEAVRVGHVSNYIPFDRQGYSVDLV